MSRPFLTQVGHLSRRSVLRVLRQPAMVVPSLTFPLILLAVNAGGLDAATKIPGFPTDSYLTFAVAICFMQGALFSAVNAGTDLAEDIETGFINRLSLTLMRGAALLCGLVSGIVVLGLIQGVVYLLVGLAAGASFAAGVGGAFVLIALALLTSLGFGALGAVLALRTGSGEAVQGFFPLLFVALFLSSISLPRNLIETGWFRTVATWNPVSYLVEGFRSLFITGWDQTALWRGFAVAGVLSVLALAAAAASLRTRLART